MSEILRVEDCFVSAYGPERELVDPLTLLHRRCPCSLHHENITIELKIRSCDPIGKTRETVIELHAANMVKSGQFYNDIVEKFPLTLILKEKDLRSG